MTNAQTDVSIEEEVCPIRCAMDVIGGKWKQPIICILAAGDALCYNELRKKMPDVTNVMLSK